SWCDSRQSLELRVDIGFLEPRLGFPPLRRAQYFLHLRERGGPIHRRGIDRRAGAKLRTALADAVHDLQELVGGRRLRTVLDRKRHIAREVVRDAFPRELLPTP